MQTVLYEKYRPTRLDDVIGQPRATAAVRSMLARGGFGGRSVWLSGPSGAGKTTLARIIAGSLADGLGVTEYDSADQVTADELREISATMQYRGMGPALTGRAFIINEAHGLRAPIIRQLLGILERIPAHVVFVFTTTRDGEEGLFEDQVDASPLLSRCIRIALTNQGLAEAFAAKALEIARAEGLDGQPIDAYIRLARKCKNNMRAMLTSIEGGAMIGGAA